MNGPTETVGFLRTQFLSTILRVFPEERIAALDSRRTQSERSKSSPRPYLTIRSGSDLSAEIHYRRKKGSSGFVGGGIRHPEAAWEEGWPVRNVLETPSGATENLRLVLPARSSDRATLSSLEHPRSFRKNRKKHGRLHAADLMQSLMASGIKDTLVHRLGVVSEPPLLPSIGVVELSALSAPEARSLPYVREVNAPMVERTGIRSGVLDVTCVRTRLQRGWTKEEPDAPQLRRIFRGWGPGDWARELRTVPVDGFKVEVRPFAIRSYDYIPALGPRLREVEDVS